VGDRRESLDVHVEQPTEGGGLGVAQLRELRGDVLDGAVVLAELHTEPLVAHASGVAVLAERRRQRGRLVVGLGDVGVAPLELLAAGVREGLRLRRRHEAQRAHGQRVVGAGPGGVAGVGERVQPRRAAAGDGPAAWFADGDDALGKQRVQVPADAGRGHVEPLGQRRRGRRPELEQQREDPLAGSRLRRLSRGHAFHNNSVS
jgi:hypothetical protein